MKIIDQGVVISAVSRSDASSCCFPSICVLETGRWIAGFRLGPSKSSRSQRAVCCWSDDEGKTWSEPLVPLRDLEHRGRPGRWRAMALTPLNGHRVLATMCWEDHSKPFQPMFNERTEGLVDMKLFTAISEDAGETWSEATPVDCGDFRDVPTPITGPALVLPDGRWAAQFEVNKHYEDPTPWKHSSALTFSSDNGRTWKQTAVTHSDPKRRVFCWDQRIAVMPDGSLLDLFWTFDRQTAAYLNIHASASGDNGGTWSDVWDTGVPGQPARPVGLGDGSISMIYVDRTAAPVIKARISSDRGKTWPAATEMLLFAPTLSSQTWKKGTMQDAWTEMSAFSLGLPDAVALPGGDMLGVFYSGPQPHETSIHWMRLRV